VADEISKCLKFVSDVYSIFGFHCKLRLSTRPDKFMGDRALWDSAEKALEDCLNKSGS